MSAHESVKVATIIAICVALALLYGFASSRTSRPARASKYFMLFPCLAAANEAAYAAATVGTILWCAVTEIGYLLLAAGIIRGRFTAFGLERRAPTIIVGIIFLAASAVQATLSLGWK